MLISFGKVANSGDVFISSILCLYNLRQHNHFFIALKTFDKFTLNKTQQCDRYFCKAKLPNLNTGLALVYFPVSDSSEKIKLSTIMAVPKQNVTFATQKVNNNLNSILNMSKGPV